MSRLVPLLLIVAALLAGGVGWLLLGGSTPTPDGSEMQGRGPADPAPVPGPDTAVAQPPTSLDAEALREPLWQVGAVPGTDEGQPAIEILGTVLDSTRSPVPGATVYATPLLACGSENPELDLIASWNQLPILAAQAIADEAGRFRVVVPENGPYVLEANGRGQGATPKVARPSADVPYSLLLQDANDLTGILHSRTGEPAVRRPVLLLEELSQTGQGYCVRRCISSLEGSFTFPNLPRQRRVLLALLDESGGAIDLAPPQESSRKLSDPRSEALPVQVIEVATGDPVVDAQVVAAGRTGFARGNTDPEGRLKLLVAPEVMNLLVRAEGLPELRQQVPWPIQEQPLVLAMGAPIRCTGVVFDPAGEPLAGAEVAWVTAKGPTETCLTDAAGEYELEVTDRVPGVIAARHAGRVAMIAARARPPSGQRQILRLMETWTQLGRVMDPEGQGIPGVTVRVGEPSQDSAVEAAVTWMTGMPLEARADADGNFQIPGLLPRPRHLVQIEQPGFAPYWEERAIHQGSVLVLRLRQLAELDGVVRTPDGTPAVQAEVILEWPQGPPLERAESTERRWRGLRTLTDEAGRFRFPEAPSGDLSLIAEGAPYPSTIQRVTLQPQQRRNVVVDLPLGHEVVVRVQTEAGAAVPGAEVRLAGAARDGSKEDRPAITDETGTHRFPYLKQGLYVVFSGRTRESVEVGGEGDPAPPPVTLRLPR